LICRNAGTGGRVHRSPMIENAPPAIEVKCPVCGQPMKWLDTIRRVFEDNLNVFQCRPCGYSLTEPESWTSHRRR
jgi:C4-type Zn-finger protein